MMDFYEWWKDYVGGDKDKSLEAGRIYAESAWDHQQQRIEALEAAAQNVCGVAEKAHNASEVYQAILELKATLLPGRGK